MKRTIAIALTLLTFTFVQSCDKEKKFERMLYKSEGAWTIESMTYTLISEDENYNIDTTSATVQDPGVFEFDKNGVGSYNFIIENLPHNEKFSWNTVSETSLSLTRNDEKYDFFTGYTKYILVALTGERTDKKEMTLTGIETIEAETDFGYTTTDLAATFKLVKK